MSCFGLRIDRPVPERRPFNRNHDYSNTPLSESKPSSLPAEDMSATKRRLVLLRRQSRTHLSLTVGFKSRTGWQPLCTSKENQDSLVVVRPLPEPNSDLSLFGVFDGHGRMGHKVSSYVAEQVVVHFKDALLDKTLSVASALKRACSRSTRALFEQKSLDITMTGTTATIVAVHDGLLTTANIGDSRIVVGTRRDGLIVPLALTDDHLPEVTRERKRIEAAGGRVDCWTPCGIDTGPPRVWLKEKRIPGLSVSRAVGDSILEGILSPQPDLCVHRLVEEDRFVVVASDGVWNVMTNEEVVQFVHAQGVRHVQVIAEDLVRMAAERWFKEEEGVDDISVIIIKLNW